MLYILILSVRIFVNDHNVDEVIEKSYSTPVFCVFYSPNCPPCRMMHPYWLQFMNKYAFDPNIIVAECESYTNHVAARKMLYFSSFPTYGLIIKGKGTILNVERTYKGFKSKAEEIKKINIRDTCGYYNESDQNLNNYPAIVIESNEGEIIDCSYLHQLSKSSGISQSHFYLSAAPFNQFIWPPQTIRDIKIIFSNSKSLYFKGKKKIKNVASFIKDQFSNPPLYDWNVNFPHKSDRKSVIIVYNDLNSIQNFYDFAYERSDKFSFSKSRFDISNSSFGFLEVKDLPAMVFPDLNNGTCSVLKNIDTNMNLRVLFDNQRFGKSTFPFKSFYRIRTKGLLFAGPAIFCIVVIIFIIKKTKPEKAE